MATNEQADADLTAEIESYVRLLTEEKVAAGIPADVARRQALMELGGTEQVKEAVRDVRPRSRRPELLPDLRYAARALLRTPVLTLVIIATLAITMGANTAIYSLAHTLLIQRLPYAAVDRVVFMKDAPLGLSITATGAEFKLGKSVRTHPVVESSALVYSGGGANLEADDVSRIAVAQITPSFMRTLGARAAIGRDFADEDGSPGRNKVLLLSNQLWRKLGARADIIGSTLRLSGVSYTVVGIMPAGVAYPIGADVWMPLPVRMELMGAAISPDVIARIRKGVSLPEAERQLNKAVLEGNPEHAAEITTLSLISLREQLAQPIRLPIILLFATVTLVLLIGCANVAALLIARVNTREMEFMVRGVLGANASRIMRQVACEALLLGIAGGLLGLFAAQATMQLVLHFFPADILSIHSAHISGAALAYTGAIAIGSALLFGIAPALRAARAGRTVPRAASMTTGREQQYARAVLVCAEIALGVMLLLCAGLLTRSLNRLESVPLGMNPDNVVTAQVRLPAARYADGAAESRYAEDLLSRITSIPGVIAAGMSSTTPFGKELASAFPVKLAGAADGPAVPGGVQPSPGQDASPNVIGLLATATPKYLDAIGARVLEGRGFSDSDSRGAPVFIVTESVARGMFGTTHAVGRRITFNRSTGDIIGIVRDLRLRSVTNEAHGVVLQPMAQAPTRYLTLAVRGNVSTAALTSAIRGSAKEVDASVPAYDLRTMRDLVSASLGARATLPRVLNLFAALAVILCALGTYGLVSELVTKQRRAMSIRVALGARPSQIVALVLRRSLILAGIGSALGLLGGMAATRVLTAFLYQTDPLDTATFLATPAFIAIVTLLATALPAVRASRIHAASMLQE